MSMTEWRNTKFGRNANVVTSTYGHAIKIRMEPMGIGWTPYGLIRKLESIMTVLPYQHQWQTIPPFVSVWFWFLCQGGSENCLMSRDHSSTESLRIAKKFTLRFCKCLSICMENMSICCYWKNLCFKSVRYGILETVTKRIYKHGIPKKNIWSMSIFFLDRARIVTLVVMDIRLSGSW